MTRGQLASFIADECESIKKMFAYKNQDYGAADDAFDNFRKTAQRIIIPNNPSLTEHEAMFQAALVLQDKHLVAMANKGINGNEIMERLTDIAVYSLLLKGIVRDANSIVATDNELHSCK